MKISDYKQYDCVRISRPNGEIIGVVSRTFVSGGNPGLRVVGVSKGRDAGIVQLYIYNAEELSLIWREDNEQL